ncbi:MAG TPA: ElyC/SanA/YdcF family protein [Propionicimonas sp.]|nr:ElyC/SanA/YdcF family protein [Propionicimonas sp.]
MSRHTRTAAAFSTVLVMLLAACLQPVPTAQASTAPITPTASATDLRVQAIYFEKTNNADQRDLAVGSLAAISPWKARLWTDFLASWDLANKGLKIYTTTPKGLPGKGHVFIVLGSSLTKSGRITTKTSRRLKVALAALAKYPASKVLVSGGAKRNGHTEAQVMADWLLDKGIKESRIMRESTSASTVSNATNSMAILARHPGFTSYTLVSDSSHIRRATILFNAAKVGIQEVTGEAWTLKPVKNVAYSDSLIASRGPVPAATHTIIASNVASVLGLTSRYKAMLAKPPAKAELTSLAVAPTAACTYQVGQKLRTSGVVVTALYNKGRYVRTVTSGATFSGFDSAKVGAVAVKVSYAATGVSKSATFGCKIVKATSSVGLTLSRKTVHKAKTRVVVRAAIATSVAGLASYGKVKFYLDGKHLKTIVLHTVDKGLTQLKLPKIAKTGTHRIEVRYLGSSKLVSAKQKLSFKVVK